MTQERPSWRWRDAHRASADRVTTVEVFFDVVFVFTLTQLTRTIVYTYDDLYRLTADQLVGSPAYLRPCATIAALGLEFTVLDIPGHPAGHIAYVGHGAVFCGDTLFNAGAGNCHNGGHPDELYKTFDQQLAKLPNSTLIYPGHDYIENNLRFTLDREPDNKSARKMLDKLAGQDPNKAYVSTLEVEGEINTFFRLTSPTVIAKLRESFPDLPEKPDQRTVFLKLRELRNSW